MEEQDNKILSELTGSEYKYGFTTDVETEIIPKGLNEEVVRLISAKKGEPEWMLAYRLEAYRRWKTMTMPRWVASFNKRINQGFCGAFPEPKVFMTTAFNPGT